MTQMRRLLLTGVLVVGAISSFVDRGTMASFTSAAASKNNTFAAGTVVLGANIVAGDKLTMTNMVPGDSFSAQLTVQNTGTLPLVYGLTTGISASSSAALSSALQLTIRTKTANACATQDGAILYGPGSLYTSSTANASFSGRQLAPNAVENLCFTVATPANASASLQESSTVATFSFQAQQS